MSKSLALLFKKEQQEQFAHGRFLKRVMWVICSLLERLNHIFTLSRTSDSLKKIHFFLHVFYWFFLFFPFYTQEQITPIVLCSVALVALLKERPWANHYHCSLKRSHESDSLFEKIDSLFRSFANKKWAICSKNQGWSNVLFKRKQRSCVLLRSL